MVTEIVDLDLGTNSSFKIITMQGDIASRFIEFHLTYNNETFDLTGKTVSCRYLNDDKMTITTNLVINDKTNGICTLDVPYTLMKNPYAARSELVIKQSNETLSTIPFTVEVVKSLVKSSLVESSDEFGALNEALWEVGGVRSELKEANSKIENINSQLDNIKNKHLKINIMDYGASGDGLTDDSKIIQDVINLTNNDLLQTLEIPQGYVFNIASGVNIVGKKKLLITGGGTLINGTITVQGENDSDKLDITFKNINFEMRYQAEYHPKTISAITLSKCSNINIFDVTFKRYGRVITFKKVGEDSHQQISRVNIQRCIFEDVDYCLYNDDISTSYYLTGDTTFANNNVYGAWKGVLRMSGCDGILMTGNTVFTPRHSLTGDMINLNKFNYVRIENNQLFESGLCTIKAKNGENLNILNNSIPYGGQNALSSAIDVLDCVMVSIQGNLIERNSNYGINIIKGDNYCSYVSISNNIVREIGVNPHYRGDDLNNSSKTPINVSSGVTRCLVDGNITDTVNVGVYNNGNNLYDDVFQKNLDLDLKVDKKTINYFCQINTLGLSETNTLITFMVNKGVTQIPSFYDNGTNMIVDDNGTARTINYIRTQTYRNDFNLIEYTCNDGDIRNSLTIHKLYQIF